MFYWLVVLTSAFLIEISNEKPHQFTSATQNYDFVCVTDVAKALYLITQKEKPFCEYIIGSGHARPLKEFMLEMQQTLVLKPNWFLVIFLLLGQTCLSTHLVLK